MLSINPQLCYHLRGLRGIIWGIPDTVAVSAAHLNHMEDRVLTHHNTTFAQFLKLVPRHEFERLAGSFTGLQTAVQPVFEIWFG